jgi:hypothetical protein
VEDREEDAKYNIKLNLKEIDFHDGWMELAQDEFRY